MGRYKQILILVIFGMICSCVLNDVLSMEKSIDTNDMNVDEIEVMLNTLERERAELDKLKSEFNGTPRTKKNVVEERTEKNIEVKSKVVLTNFTKKSIEEKEGLVEQNGFPYKEEEKVKKVITLENQGEGVEKSEKVVVNTGDEIIHPFEIAENLYKLGEYKTALDIYKLIVKDGITEDNKKWVLYQIANCYRKLGSYSDAVGAYREMQKTYEGTYWANQSKWYIKDIMWRIKIEEEIEKVVER